jgi:hypothetical protein
LIRKQLPKIDKINPSLRSSQSLSHQLVIVGKLMRQPQLCRALIAVAGLHFLLVSFGLPQDKGVGWGIFGVICGLYTFIWGWQNYARFDLKNIMMIWTAAFVTSIIVRILVMTMTTAGGVAN